MVSVYCCVYTLLKLLCVLELRQEYLTILAECWKYFGQNQPMDFQQ